MKGSGNNGLQDRPCARCVKRSIGHLCHDEPRDPAKGVKQDQASILSISGGALKQEDSLPYMLGPSLDEQQLDQQALQDAGGNITTGTSVPDSQIDGLQFQPQSSNPIPQSQGQVLGDKNQQCKKHIKSFSSMNILTVRNSPWLRRLEPGQSESVLGYA